MSKQALICSQRQHVLKLLREMKRLIPWPTSRMSCQFCATRIDSAAILYRVEATSSGPISVFLDPNSRFLVVDIRVLPDLL
jgi:hypothetical protein